jgi:hypothetical protein
MSEWSTRPRSAITPLKRFALWGRSVFWGCVGVLFVTN